jgi:hypothetical protein
LFPRRKDSDLANDFRQMPIDAGKFSHYVVSVNGKVRFCHGGLRSLEDRCIGVKSEAERHTLKIAIVGN